ncbi:MAG: hypothetical protein ACOY3P_26910 [Planctomycetota bacterium]
MFSRHLRRIGILAPLAVVLSVLARPVAVEACSVPVFRYALEQWTPDPYLLLVFSHDDGKLSISEWIEKLKLPVDENGQPLANLLPVSMSLTEPPGNPRFKTIWEENHDKAKPGHPWGVVCYPEAAGLEQAAWAGPLTDEALKALLHSPARSELVKRMVGGDSVVWLLLGSGDEKADAKLQKKLTKDVHALAEQVELPEILEADMQYLSGTASDGQLKFAMSVVFVKRDDPAEKSFVELLLGTLPGVDEESEETAVAFPVFGRGRAFTALSADELIDDYLESVVSFMAGPCSCQVKAGNPGIDLLVTADWEKSLTEGSVKISETAALTTPVGLADAHRLAPADGGPDDITTQSAGTGSDKGDADAPATDEPSNATPTAAATDASARGTASATTDPTPASTAEEPVAPADGATAPSADAGNGPSAAGVSAVRATEAAAASDTQAATSTAPEADPSGNAGVPRVFANMAVVAVLAVTVVAILTLMLLRRGS